MSDDVSPIIKYIKLFIGIKEEIFTIQLKKKTRHSNKSIFVYFSNILFVEDN
jgi:hypothetical protein